MVDRQEFTSHQVTPEDDRRYAGAFWERLRDARWTREQIENMKAK